MTFSTSKKKSPSGAGSQVMTRHIGVQRGGIIFIVGKLFSPARMDFSTYVGEIQQ
jgi:hypothetical protein